MGMLDQELMFMDGLAVTGTGDTAGSVYDTGGTNGQGDMGQTGENLWFNVRARTTATSGGAATIQGVIQASDDNATWTDIAVGTPTPVATVVAGYDLLRIQPPVSPYGSPSRYIRAVVRVATAALTGGTFDAYVSNTIQRNIYRNSAFTVS